MKNIGKIGIVSLCILLLTGCANNAGEKEETVKGGVKLTAMNPENIADKVDKIDPSSRSSTFVFVTGANMEIIMSGSSTCPPKISKVVEDASGLDIYTVKPEENRACSADIRYFGWAGLFSSTDIAQNTTFARVIVGDNPSTDMIDPVDFTRIPPE